MGCWQVRGKGWRYQFQHQGELFSGQWFPTKGEARAAKEEHRRRLKAGPTGSASPPSWDFDSLILDYLAEARRQFQPKTWKYKRYVYQSFRDFAGNLPLEDLTGHLVAQYLLTRPSNYNYNFHRKDLSALFRWAVDRDLMPANPCRRIKKLPVRQAETIHLTPDEWNRFLLAAGPDRPFFLTVFYTLGRAGEIYRLKWEDLDWQRSEIRLRTRKRRGGQLEEDWLPLAPELREHLLALQRRREHPEYVFPNPRTGRPFNQRRRRLLSICRQAGVRPFGYHAIRHLGADRLMAAGQDLRTISRYLRHKSLATTEHYLRRRPDASLRQAALSLQNEKPLTPPAHNAGNENGF